MRNLTEVHLYCRCNFEPSWLRHLFLDEPFLVPGGLLGREKVRRGRDGAAMTVRSCIGNTDGLQSNFSWRQVAPKLTLPGCALYPESCIYSPAGLAWNFGSYPVAGTGCLRSRSLKGTRMALAAATDPHTLPALTKDEVLRYSRHLILPEVGMEGQQKLKAAKVLCIGAGGLGSPLALYLAAAGVGTLGIVDFDIVDVTNLQRQILHNTDDVGHRKLDSAATKLKALNPHLNLLTYETKLTSENALELFAQFDMVVDGTDNFPTRYLVNDACVLTGKPNIYGSIFRFEGQASVFATEDGPCYRCLYPERPPPGLVPSCAEGGVLGILPGLVGVIQATEGIKLILGQGDSLVGRLLLVDALGMKFRELKLRKSPDCHVCGKNPHVTKLI